jgi:large subunit ribosomal protein L15
VTSKISAQEGKLTHSVYENFLRVSFSLDMTTVNLDRIQEWIDQGRIDPKRPITIRELAHSRCVHQTKDGVKVLARGGENALKQPIHLVVSRASATAIAAVETVGGSVTTRFYTRWAIQRILRGQIHPWLSMAWSQKSGPAMLYKDFVEFGANTVAATSPKTADWSLMTTTKSTEETSPSSPQINSALAEIQMMKAKGYEYRLPDPSNRKDVEYYRDPAHRGYLSHLVGPTEGPSLFFLPPAQRKSSAGVKKEKVLPENRLW